MKYPNIKVKLIDRDGNAFAILVTMQKALRKADVPKEEIKKFMDEGKSGDYDNLLRVCMDWVDVH